MGQKLAQVYSQTAPEQGLSLVFFEQTLQFTFAEGQPLLGLLPKRPVSGIPNANANAAPLPPSPFAMLLRKTLKGARLTELRAIPGDRILVLEWQSWQDNPPCLSLLVMEMTGRHSNLFLLDAQQRLLGSWRSDRSQLRQLKTGAPYQFPPRPPAPLEKPVSSAKLHALNAEMPGADTPAGVSLISALPADGSRSALFWQTAAEDAQIRALQAQIRRIDQGLQAQHNALEKQIRSWERELQRAEAAPQWQHWAELLQGAWHQPPPAGAPSVRVKDYYLPEQPEVEIPLDPALGFQANLAQYFRRAARLRKTQSHAEAQLLTLWQKLEVQQDWQVRWQRLQSEIEDKDTRFAAGEVHANVAQLNAFEQEAQAAGCLLCPRVQPKPQREQEKAALPWREFLSKQGQLIRVGKGASGNEAMLKQARGHDLWLHTRDWPGAYVWIPVAKNSTVTPETLGEAAQLALHYSQKPEEPKAEIMFTAFKYLHKVRKGKPGEVSVSQSKTLIISRDPGCLEALFGRKRH